MADDKALVPAQAKDLTPEQVQDHVDRAFELEIKIKQSYARVHEAWWVCSAQLYAFHEGGYWRTLSYDTLDEFLAQPDLGMSRRQFFQMTKLWRELVVVKQIEPATLADIEPGKVREVTPAIMRGDVTVEAGLADARELGYRDVVEKYRPANIAKHGQQPDGSTPLDADAEPERVKCEACGSWYVPDDNHERTRT